MKKLKVLFTVLILFIGIGMAMGQDDDQRLRKNSSNMNARERTIVNNGLDHVYANETAIALRSTLASPTFTGTVVIPSPFTLGATSVTSTGAKLNYLTGATGTTGTATTNLVYSASPTFTGTVVLPILDVGGDITLQNDAQIENAIDGIMTITEPIVAVMGDLTVSGGVSQTATVTEYTTIVTIDSTKIAGSAAGDIGHSAGAILVAAPTSDYTLEFVSAVIFYDYSGAAFAGGGDDLVVQLGTVAQTGVIAAADLLTAAGDKITMVTPLSAADLPMTVGTTLNLKGTAYTNDAGTATGSLRVHITYRRHTTGF